MALDFDLRKLMQNTITVYRTTAFDSYGGRTYDAGTEYNAYVQYGVERVYNDEGDEEQIAGGRIFVDGAPRVRIDDQIELPDGTRPRIINVEYWTDEQGDHHEVILFKDSATL